MGVFNYGFITYINGGSIVPNIGRYSADYGEFCVSAGTGGQFQFPSSFPVTPLVASYFTNVTAGVTVCGVGSVWHPTKTISNLIGGETAGKLIIQDNQLNATITVYY